uniref:Uncharacterized protein n=1 Tax=Panagrolaimus sp. ES5 TaxID=591445 RepID=A0AC34G845_9BILA
MNGDDSLNLKSSTLSLHIEAYENSIEALTQNKVDNFAGQGTQKKNKFDEIRHKFGLGSSVSKFEIPRQQEKKEEKKKEEGDGNGNGNGKKDDEKDDDTRETNLINVKTK